MSHDDGGDYEVGYGKPPKHSRWKKGDPSPNPGGRPKKPVEDAAARVRRILIEPLRSRTDGKEIVYSAQEVIFRRVIADAALGKQRAFALLIRWMKRAKLFTRQIPQNERPKRGVMVVPKMLSPEEWEKEALAYYAAGGPNRGYPADQ